jgi:hypothetical protein
MFFIFFIKLSQTYKIFFIELSIYLYIYIYLIYILLYYLNLLLLKKYEIEKNLYGFGGPAFRSRPC